MSKSLIDRSTPGEILKEEFLVPMGITPYALANWIGADPPRIAAILKDRRNITAVTAVRLSKFLGTTPEFWMNMQSRFDLEVVTEEKERENNRIAQFHGASFVADTEKDR